MTELAAGAKAPAFKLSNQDGSEVSLADYKGKKLVLYFYPAASTPACTKEAVDFKDALGVLGKAGYTVVGVSPDSVSKISKFHSSQKLGFDLLSDEDHSVHKLYGAFGKKSMYGRIYEGVIRSTFVIDETGKISMPLYNVRATGHVAMLLKLLEL
ncbi:MAG: thioredoxin-dependent thiol peroxidase [Micrococcales bacterium]